MPEDQEKQAWQEHGGFAADTARITIVCKEDQKTELKEEAEKNGYSSTSKYLFELIQEARLYRNEGLLSFEGNQKRKQELEEQVEHLEHRLREKRSESSTAISFDPRDLKAKFLTENYQTLDEILRDIVESGEMDDALRQPVENQLYFLAARDEVVYERGWGWKLSEGSGGEER